MARDDRCGEMLRLVGIGVHRQQDNRTDGRTRNGLYTSVGLFNSLCSAESIQPLDPLRRFGY